MTVLSRPDAWRRTLGALCVAAALSAPAQEAAPPPEEPPRDSPGAPAPAGAGRRGSWYFGLGLGYGNGRMDVGGASRDFDELVGDDPFHAAFEIRAGARLTPTLLLGVDTGFVSASRSSLFSGTTNLQASHYDVEVTWFPGARGLFLRAGTGYSRANLDDASGVNVLAGIGYAFRLGETFHLALNVQGASHWYRGSDLDASREYALYLGLDWY